MKFLTSKLSGVLLLITASVFSVNSASAGGDVYRPSIWSGFYAGLHGGYAEANYDGIFDNDGDEAFAEDLDPHGGMVGVHVGYNWHRGNILLGLEADVSATSLDDSATDRDGGNDDLITGDVDFLGSIRGRLGIVSGSTLIYATGGLAFADASYTAVDNDSGDRSSGTVDFDDVGYVVGGGIEKMFSGFGKSLRFRLEGLYYNFDDTVDTSNLAPTDSDDGDFATFEDIWTIRAGVSVPFN